MRVKWLEKLASDIEKKHGKEARDKIFGDIQGVPKKREAEKEWFDNFIRGMDELNDREFLADMMERRCPCGHPSLVKKKKKYWNESKSTEEFGELLLKDGIDDVDYPKTK
jgi:hypothetical protein